jgi:hypothetical protein
MSVPGTLLATGIDQRMIENETSVETCVSNGSAKP